MGGALRDALVVASFELRSSLRSRKALLLLLLYLAGATAASGGFVAVLRTAERTMADTLQVARTDRPGTMTDSIMESEQLLDVIDGLIGDRELAAELVRIPPLALFYGWVALTFVPVLVTLTSADAIAADVDSGASRFALVRTTRGAWAAGKLLGQVLLMAAGLGLGAVGSWLVGFFSLSRFPPVESAVWMLRLGGRACIVGFAWLGFSLCISQLTRSANKARAFGLLFLVGMGMMRQVLHIPELHDRAPGPIDSLLVLFPGSHVLDLWRPDPAERFPAVLILLALGGAAFVAGHARFLRRDG